MVQTDGKILAGGAFDTIGGQARNYIARLDAVTGLADSFNPHASNSVQSIALQPDGKILVGGLFGDIGNQIRRQIARLDATTGLADSFAANLSPHTTGVPSIAMQADGKVLVGGDFTTVAPSGGASITRNYIARLETDGRVDQALISPVETVVYATAAQPDGKILIGGLFSTVLGVTRNNIARLNTDGTLDTAFNPNADGVVFSIAVQPDGKILVGGGFTVIGGQTRNSIARLDATTGAADAFDPNPNAGVVSIAVQADGKILVGGHFMSIGGQPRNRIARLDAAHRVGRFVQPERKRFRRFDRGANGRQDFSGWRVRRSEQHRWTTAQSHRAARCHHRVGRFVQPERERFCLCDRGPGGRQDFSGRAVHRYRPAAAQPHRAARCRDRISRFVQPKRE